MIPNFLIMVPALLVAVAAHAAPRACGLDGTVSERIADCASAIPDYCEGPMTVVFAQVKTCATVVIKSEAGDFTWKLVSRASEGLDVWRDEKTGLVWSARFQKQVPWKAAVKICEIARNGNLDITARLALGFRVPTDADFNAADLHGIGAVLPAVSKGRYWSADADSRGVHAAAFLRNGFRYVFTRTSGEQSFSYVRCVGSSSVDPTSSEGAFKGMGEAESSHKAGDRSGRLSTD